MIVGYARVSTATDEQAISVDAQVEQLKSAGCDRVIREQGSAFKEDSRRPGWEELQGLVATGQVRKVVAISQSRLSRREDALTFLRMCARKGVEVQFLDGTPGDISDPAGRLMTGVLAAVNEVDSLIKSINIKNGLQRRRDQGYYACGRVPFGYCYDGQHAQPHPEEFGQALELWQRLEDAEFNVSQVIRRFQYDWSTRGIRRWIQNPMLRGVVRGQAEAVKPLITAQQYANALEILSKRQQKRCRAPRRKRLLSGLMRCQACDKRLHYVMAAGKPRMKCFNLHCRWYGRGLAEEKIRAQVLKALESRHEALATAGVAPADEVVTQEALERQQQLQQLLDLRQQGVPGLDRAITALQQQETLPRASAPNWESLAAVLATPGVLAAATDEELRAILLEFVDEIVYIGDPQTVEVVLR